MSHKFSEEDKKFILENEGKLSRKEIAQKLVLEKVESISWFLRRLRLREEKEGKKHKKSISEGTKKATAPINSENKKTFPSQKKVMEYTDQIEKGKKYKTIKVEDFIKKDSKDYENELTLLFQAIRKCVLKDTSTYLSGHSKLRYVSHGFFVKLSTNE